MKISVPNSVYIKLAAEYESDKILSLEEYAPFLEKLVIELIAYIDILEHGIYLEEGKR